MRRIRGVILVFGLAVLALPAACGDSRTKHEGPTAQSPSPVTAPFLTPRKERIGTFSAGSWSLDFNGNGIWDGCAVDRCLIFGGSGDVPVVGNWGGPGGFHSIGVFRPSDHTWYLDYNGSGFFDNCVLDRCYSSFTYNAGDQPVAGAWSSGSPYRIGMFRNGQWLLDNGNGSWDGCGTDTCWNFGQAGDRAVPGDWSGSSGHRAGVFRSGSWFLDNGNGAWDGCTLDTCGGTFGQAGDKPFAWRKSLQVSHVGTFSNGAWFLDANNDKVFTNCTTDDCVTAGSFGSSTFTPVTGDWPKIQWAAFGDRTLVNAGSFENSATVVGPGVDNDCPTGRAFIGTGGPLGLRTANLDCMDTCDSDIFSTHLAPKLTSTANLVQDPFISSDSQLVRLNNGDILYIRQARNRRNLNTTTDRLANAYYEYGSYVIWRSTDCGNTWGNAFTIDSTVPLNGRCALRQGWDTAAVYRPSDNKFYIDQNRDWVWSVPPAPAVADQSFTFAGMQSTDIPIVGDWNGGGTTIGFFRNGYWQIDFNNNRQFDGCTNDLCIGTGAPSDPPFGQAGDVPVVGRWSNPGSLLDKPDMRTQIGVFRNGTWILDTNSNGKWDSATDQSFVFGQAGDVPIVGQWGNTGILSTRTRVGVFRPSTNEWLLDQGADGWNGCSVDICYSNFGASPQKPIVGIWENSQYRERVGMFHNGSWHRDVDGDGVYDGAGETIGNFGGAGDIPLIGNFAGSFGGFDRPEAYADPFNGMVYLTASCDYRTSSETVLLSSHSNGSGWASTTIAPYRATPMRITSTPGGKLYLFSATSGDPRLWPATVNASLNTVTIHNNWFIYAQNGAFSGPTPPAGSGSFVDRYQNLPSLLDQRPFDGSESITRIGRSGNVDSIRVFYPSLETRGGTGVNTQIVRTARVDVTTTSNGVTGMVATALPKIVATANLGSVAQATIVEGPANLPVDLVYWKETDGSQAGALGNVRTRATVFRDGATILPTINLSLDGSGNARTWNNHANTGDYQRGASYGGSGVAGYFVQWVETPLVAGVRADSLHAESLSVLYP